VVKFYNGRGTAEQWIKEGKNAVKWTKLSCHDFADNQVRLQLFALAYNLGNFLRRLALPRSVKHWSLIPMYIGTAREADQDRGEGRDARPVRHLPDGRGGRAQVVVPGNPGADSTVATARGGAGMTARTVETTGGRGGDGDGLRGSAMNASAQAALGKTMARKRPNYLAEERKECLRTLRSVVKLSERPTKIVGRRLSGKSRIRILIERGVK